MDDFTNKRLGELIFDLAKGKITALAEIHLIMYKILYAVGNIYLRQKADIEDEIQNLLLVLYEKAYKYKINKNACAWILNIYRNMILNHLKSGKREENFIADKAQLMLLESQNNDSVYIENNLFINEIFKSLTEYERDLLIYRYWCKCTIQEVADIVAAPKSTVQSQLIKLENKIKNL